MIPFDRPLVVTDTETTGLSPTRNRIIEIGALRVVDGEESVSFSQLIDPGESIPYRITRLTGITSTMVFGCPDASEVIPAFSDFLGDGLLVAHNLKFDLGFLNAERGRLGLQPLENAGLCTARLARRLLPGLRSKGLDSLSRFFRIASHGRHRALRDVEITAEILERLIAIAHQEHKVESIDELIEMQSRTYARINPFSQHIIRIRREILPDVPDRPGVYRMLDRAGRVLYVGKAKVLSRRVRSYFNAIEGHTPRIRELVSKLRGVEWTPTRTELEALLLESRQIRELDPPFNRAQKRTTPRPYLRIASDVPFPRITAHVFPANDAAEYYGPLRSRGEAKAILEIIERFYPVRTCDDREFKTSRRCLRADIGRCDAPCENGISAEAYDDVLGRVRAFLAGEVDTILERLEREMQDASHELAFEEAARLRDLGNVVARRVERNGCVAPRIMDDDAIVLHADPETGAREVLVIRAGRFVASLSRFSPDRKNSIRRLEDLFSSVFEFGTEIEGASLRRDVNEIRVLLHWLYASRDRIVRIIRDPELDGEQLALNVNEAARDLFSAASITNSVDEPEGKTDADGESTGGVLNQAS